MLCHPLFLVPFSLLCCSLSERINLNLTFWTCVLASCSRGDRNGVPVRSLLTVYQKGAANVDGKLMCVMLVELTG